MNMIMSTFKLKHRNSGRWVMDLEYELNYAENHAGDIDGIEAIVFTEHNKHAKVFDMSKYTPHETDRPLFDIYAEYDLEPYFSSSKKYRFWSQEGLGWLVYISPVKDLSSSPILQFKNGHHKSALQISTDDTATISWLKENTELQYIEVKEDDDE